MKSVCSNCGGDLVNGNALGACTRCGHSLTGALWTLEPPSQRRISPRPSGAGASAGWRLGAQVLAGVLAGCVASVILFGLIRAEQLADRGRSNGGDNVGAVTGGSVTNGAVTSGGVTSGPLAGSPVAGSPVAGSPVAGSSGADDADERVSATSQPALRPGPSTGLSPSKHAAVVPAGFAGNSPLLHANAPARTLGALADGTGNR